MTLAEGQAILATVTYKEGWSFKLTEGGLVTSRNLEADSTGRILLKDKETLIIERPCHFPLEAIQDPQCLIDIIHSEITWLEMHELDEWFKVNNKLWHDPHAPGRHKVVQAGLCTQFTVL